jgi:hypothetical protein
MGRSIKTLIFVAVMIVGVLLAIPIIAHANEPERCTQRLAPLSNKPLTQKQFREYKELRRIGLTKKDAAQAARDPGVKKGEWGWTQGGDKGAMCVKKEGSEWLSKYRNNVVVE